MDDKFIKELIQKAFYHIRSEMCIKSCEGITTPALEAGVIKEMVELVKIIKHDIDKCGAGIYSTEVKSILTKLEMKDE